jgi:hypothetical protein
MTAHSRKELVEKYVRAAWVLKIRLMSARRHLWTTETSLIHIETACLQIRKICESISYLCVIAAEIEFDERTTHRTNYKVGQVFARLSKDAKLLFPASGRLAAIWEVSIWRKLVHDFSRTVMDALHPGDG